MLLLSELSDHWSPALGPARRGWPWFGAQGGPLTPPSCPAPQPVGVLPVAQVVDEGAQGLLVVDVLCDHHLLLDDVRLWQVGTSLQGEWPQLWSVHRAPPVVCTSSLPTPLVATLLLIRAVSPNTETHTCPLPHSEAPQLGLLMPPALLLC